MDEIKNDIILTLVGNPGLSDGELAQAIKGHVVSSKSINQICRSLESQRMLLRHKREDGLIGNWLIKTSYPHKVFHQNKIENKSSDISDKKIKKILSNHLTSLGWDHEISWDISHGVDIEAKRGKNRWIIQVKGAESLHPVVVNNFLLVLGEIFQRMDDPNSKYSVALPDEEPFHRLWKRLPGLAKSRMKLTALFVNPEGKVVEEV
jgi:hypothetical protein